MTLAIKGTAKMGFIASLREAIPSKRQKWLPAEFRFFYTTRNA
jgi:hypothetical protein